MQRPQGWAPGFLHLCICQRRQGGQGVKEEAPALMGCRPCVDGLPPPLFLTLTLAPVWNGESAPPRPLPSMAAQPERRPGCSVAPPGQALWSTLSGFLYYSVTFFILL